jgi:glycosyltransferase involved in cell wall biosynthesis
MVVGAETMLVACMPAYNEERSIAKALLGTQPYVDKIIVCDDGSTDMTGLIAERLGAIVIRHATNQGKGVALRDLFKKAVEVGADIAVTLDADCQHDPREIRALIEPLLEGRADITNGSRFLNPAHIPAYRRFGIRVLNAFTNAFSSGNVTDTQSGFRAYSKKALSTIEIKEKDIGVDSQILLDAPSKGLRVAEVSTSVKYDEESSTYNPVHHGSKVVTSILKIVALKSPLKYLGGLGVILLIIGSFAFTRLLDLYNMSRYFSLPYALIAVTFILSALLFIITALLLFTLSQYTSDLRK